MNLIKKTVLVDCSGSFKLIKPQELNNAPLISVVMSVYNGGKFLRESIDSILSQTCKNFEFIIINDASTDSTREIIRSYNDPRIVLVENKENIGLTRSLNRAIKLARGRYIARMDADDISLPRRLEIQLNYIEKHPEVAVVGCCGDVFGTNGIIQACGNSGLSAGEIKRYLGKKNLFMHGSVMMRKSCLEKVGCYREFFRFSQDYDLWLRLSQHFDIVLLPDYLYRYRLAENSITVVQSATQKRYADIARKFHTERLATGKDSYDSLVSSYPDGLVVDQLVNKYNCHIYMAEQFVVANRLTQARSELRQAWRLGCRDWKIFYLFLKTLLGADLLNICRKLKKCTFRV